MVLVQYWQGTLLVGILGSVFELTSKTIFCHLILIFVKMLDCMDSNAKRDLLKKQMQKFELNILEKIVDNLDRYFHSGEHRHNTPM